MAKKRLLILFNQLLTPQISTGGDVLSTEIISNLNFYFEVISPSFAHHDLVSKIKDATFFSSDDSKIHYPGGLVGGLKILLSYIHRTIKTINVFSQIKKADGIYLTGDFFCNSVPSIIYKILHPKTKIFCNFYHLNPLPWKRENNVIFSITSWFLQHFSLLIMRPFVDKFFVLSQEGKDILKRFGIKDHKILISGAGVGNSFSKIIGTKGYSHCDILFVGRLNKTKGIFDAIHCLKMIKKTIPDVKMGIVGSCTESDMKKIRKMVIKHKLDNNFHYFGYISNEEKIKLMKSTTVLIAPSYEEGFGIGILEGITSGMRVVAYSLPVYKLIFDKYKSRINYVQIGDIKAMSNIIIRLLKNDKTTNKFIKVPTWDDIAKIQEDVITKHLS
ncbi:glycosyltransferase family 1 protein [bacterium]|nr:MAG: glycosyltransferase family 1 protein [bacterium]